MFKPHVHLRKLGLKCTGTIRDNRVKEKNVIDNRAPRGEYVVKHEKNSGMNYITVVDSKPVLIVSTASGVDNSFITFEEVQFTSTIQS